jgi:hypothetical protein
MNPGLIPPADVAVFAQRGLELREKFHRGGTSVGVRRAKELTERRPLSLRDVVAMSAYFARHEVDKASMSHEWGDEGDPSAGYVAAAVGRRPRPPLGRQFNGAPEQDRGGIIAAARGKAMSGGTKATPPPAISRGSSGAASPAAVGPTASRRG